MSYSSKKSLQFLTKQNPQIKVNKYYLFLCQMDKGFADKTMSEEV